MRIFISHKAVDFATAEKVSAALKGLAGTKARGRNPEIKIFLSEEIPYGDDWLKCLHEELERADVLVLIYTDPDENWSWCMYEVGYFASTHDFEKRGSSRERQASERRIYCLHHPSLPPPPPLERLQVVKADTYRVRRFVEDFIKEAKVAQDPAKIAEAVKNITDCFEQRDAVSYAAPRLTLIVKDKDKIDPFAASLEEALPRGSFFTGRDITTIFKRGVDQDALSWHEAVAFTRRMAKHADTREYFEMKWLFELVDIMFNAKDDHYDPSLLLRGLVSRGSSQAYSPAIRKISKRRDGALACEILFLDWEGYQYPKAPEHIRQLMIAVRVAVRFRQEFLEEFKGIGAAAAFEGSLGQARAFKH